MSQKIAIVGAGPIGLEAGLYAAELGYEVDIFEKGAVGGNILQWGHVTLFSPWEMNHSPLGVRALQQAFPEWTAPKPDDYLNGKQHVERYLRPLSRLPQLQGRIHTGAEVVSIGRERILKGELIGNVKRTEYPFRLLVRDASGEERIHSADIVIDASGVYGHPNYLGEGGIPAPGELANRHRIDYHLRDVRGKDRRQFAGRRTLVVGSGYSAATTVCDLADLIQEAPGTRVLWTIREKRDLPIVPIADDPLPNRAALTEKANQLAQNGSPEIEFRCDTVVEFVRYLEHEDRFVVGIKSGSAREEVIVDRIVANVGYGPDNRLYRELQVHECYATRGPMKLAAALLGSSSTDCLTQTSMGADTLKNPEPNFYIIGNKSYGRNPTFLIRLGLSQIVEVFSLITGERELNLYEPSGGQGALAGGGPKPAASGASSGVQAAAEAPTVPLHSLDTLWFQVGGTICNLWCTHCFISCSPENHKFGFMSRESVRRYLEASRELGVKEYYFTGGEPFMNRDLLGILEDTLALGPATVLTNGILIQERVARRLKEIVDHSRYSLELRVSIDGFTAESNDAIRGKGSFDKAMQGVRNLVRFGFLPIITAAQTWDDDETELVFQGFRKTLLDLGYTRPRIKLIPPLRIGREKVRSRGYDQFEYVTPEMMADYDDNLLQCTHSRMVTDQGVYVCPILIDYPEAKLSDTLEGAFKPYPLQHQACYTCYLSGAICHNYSAVEIN